MSTNPYQPPSAFSEFEPSNYPPPRPTSATVFGVLHLLFGVCGLCGITMSGAMLFVPLSPEMTRNNPALSLMQESAIYYAFMIISVALGFITCVVLIIAGVGLLQLQTYGRNLSIVYGVYAIGMHLIGTLVNIF